MSTLSSHLKNAVDRHKAGDVADARVLYEEILRLDPSHADALHLLGVTHLQTGNAETALEYILRAVRQFPDRAEYLRNLAEAHYEAGAIEKAIASYRDFLKQNPDDAKALFRLGCFLRESNETDYARVCFENAVRIQPGFVEARFNLANILRENKEYNLAEDHYRNALFLKPDFSQARLNLGLCLQSQGHLDQASEQFLELLKFDPRNSKAHNNLGNLFREQNEKRKAVEHYRKAVELDSDFVEALDNLGSLLLEWGEHAEAKRILTLATAKNERFVKAWVNLGNVDFDLCDLDSAENAYRKAIELDPNGIDAKYNLSLVQLTRGDFRNGWQGYELRRKLASHKWPSFEQPLWQGEPLAGKTILLDCEQGLGDTLQFLRYVNEVKRRDARVVVRCQPALKELLRRTPGIDDLVADGEELPEFDCWSPLLSLPAILRTEIATIPNEIPYLLADEPQVEIFHRKFANETDFLIGIAWQGNSEYRRDRFRSIPLEEFRAIAELPDVKLVSLQKLPSEQLHDRKYQELIAEDFNGRLDEDTAPFVETAAVMKNLDLVITADTVIGHLAGGLGLPVFVALSAIPEWRWMIDRDDSPWYPTMRLFRQNQLQNWKSVFSEIEKEIKLLVKEKIE